MGRCRLWQRQLRLVARGDGSSCLFSRPRSGLYRGARLECAPERRLACCFRLRPFFALCVAGRTSENNLPSGSVSRSATRCACRGSPERSATASAGRSPICQSRIVYSCAVFLRAPFGYCARFTAAYRRMRKKSRAGLARVYSVKNSQFERLLERAPSHRVEGGALAGGIFGRTKFGKRCADAFRKGGRASSSARLLKRRLPLMNVQPNNRDANALTCGGVARVVFSSVVRAADVVIITVSHPLSSFYQRWPAFKTRQSTQGTEYARRKQSQVRSRRIWTRSPFAKLGVAQHFSRRVHEQAIPGLKWTEIRLRARNASAAFEAPGS